LLKALICRRVGTAHQPYVSDIYLGMDEFLVLSFEF